MGYRCWRIGEEDEGGGAWGCRCVSERRGFVGVSMEN